MVNAGESHGASHRKDRDVRWPQSTGSFRAGEPVFQSAFFPGRVFSSRFFPDSELYGLPISVRGAFSHKNCRKFLKNIFENARPFRSAIFLWCRALFLRRRKTRKIGQTTD